MNALFKSGDWVALYKEGPYEDGVYRLKKDHPYQVDEPCVEQCSGVVWITLCGIPFGNQYNQNHFRPIQDLGTSVEEHINKLIKEEDLKTISV